MSPPPPPPLGRSRKKAAHTFDAALDDTELVTARAALAQGRWTEVRALLAATGADESYSEGVVDHMRAVEGTAVAVLVRDLLSEDRNGIRKVSLRATDGSVDVSRIAREFGGGGHPQAAGFSTPVPYAELVDQPFLLRTGEAHRDAQGLQLFGL